MKKKGHGGKGGREGAREGGKQYKGGVFAVFFFFVAIID
jgi:hypothetical protein